MSLEKWVIAIEGIGLVLTTLILVIPPHRDHMILVPKIEIVPVEVVVMNISLKDQDHQVCMMINDLKVLNCNVSNTESCLCKLITTDSFTDVPWKLDSCELFDIFNYFDTISKIFGNSG